MQKKDEMQKAFAGILFDFMGFLTSRPDEITLSSHDLVPPAIKAIEDFAAKRDLSLLDADVHGWEKYIKGDA